MVSLNEGFFPSSPRGDTLTDQPRTDFLITLITAVTRILCRSLSCGKFRHYSNLSRGLALLSSRAAVWQPGREAESIEGWLFCNAPA